MGNDSTAEAFVQAGLEVLAEHPETLLRQGLRTEDVLERVHLARATFHRTFKNRELFLEQVADGLLPEGIYTTEQFAAAIRDRLTTNSMRRGTALYKLVAAHFGQLTDPALITRRLLANLLLSGNDRRAFRVRADYARRDKLALAAFEAAFGKVGGSLRRPLTKRSFPVVLIAMMDGLLLRHRIDPTAVSPDLMVDALLAFLGAAVDVGQDFEPIVDAVARVETERGTTEPARQLDPRTAVIDAARKEFAARGLFAAKLEDIAAEAKVPLAGFRAVFNSKEHIIVDALRPSVNSLRVSVAYDLRLLTNEQEIVENHLQRLARLTVEERPFVDAMLAAVVHSTYGDPSGTLEIKKELNLPGIIAPAIARGQEHGVFVDDHSAVDIAAGLTNALLLRCFTRRDADPADNASFIADTTLRGVLDPREGRSPRPAAVG